MKEGSGGRMILRSFLYLAGERKKRLPVDGLEVVRGGNAVMTVIFFALPERDDPWPSGLPFHREKRGTFRTLRSARDHLCTWLYHENTSIHPRICLGHLTKPVRSRFCVAFSIFPRG